MFPASAANWLTCEAGAFVFFSAHLEGEDAYEVEGATSQPLPLLALGIILVLLLLFRRILFSEALSFVGLVE